MEMDAIHTELCHSMPAAWVPVVSERRGVPSGSVFLGLALK